MNNFQSKPDDVVRPHAKLTTVRGIEDPRKWGAGLTGLAFFLSMMPVGSVLPRAMAAAPLAGTVVINEVAWAGSADGSNDEWLELYNNSGATVDLSNWKIKDDGVVAFTFPAGATIASHGYSLIEDNENAVADRTADFIYNMSLANTGDSLELLDNNGESIDIVNGSGGAWYAGSSTNYSTMERIDPTVGDLAANFAASTGSGAHGSAGALLVGTPQAVNSVYTGGTSAIDRISAEFANNNWQVGQTVKVQIKAENVSNLFAYGFGIDYDPSVLEYQNAVVGSFLGNSGQDQTSFQAALKDSQAGSLLVAEARTINPKTGINGSGLLLEINFKVLTVPVNNTAVIFSSDSFASSPSGDLNETYLSATYDAASAGIEPVTNLIVSEGAQRYQIKLSWAASTSNPELYRVERKDAHGNWVIIGNPTGTEFTDQDGLVGGGAIVPQLVYDYRISAVKAGQTSLAVNIQGQDTRGLKGDNTRSDLVDGRDLERLALHFSEDDQFANFDRLVDTTYDGVINGSDLIDLGVTFAHQY